MKSAAAYWRPIMTRIKSDVSTSSPQVVLTVPAITTFTGHHARSGKFTGSQRHDSAGQSVADPKEMDGDVILAAQARPVGFFFFFFCFFRAMVATENVGHLALV
jgi:hypothetical protein